MTEKLPEGVELSLTCYFTSDETGLNIALSLYGITAPIPMPIDVDKLRSQLPDLASDWRVMTREEFKAYKEDCEGAVEPDEYDEGAVEPDEYDDGVD